MSDKSADTKTAHQLELIISQLDSLSILPSAAARFLSMLNSMELTTSDLTELIESEPALTTKIFSLLYQSNQPLPDKPPFIRTALEKLPLRLIRDSFLAARVYNAPVLAEDEVDSRQGLVLHSLAVACAARQLATLTSPQIDPNLAYTAGLLHDIGKLALNQVMPKSFTKITEEAKSRNLSTCTIEQRHLGLDHTIIGKRLAQKWHLPTKIDIAIWLHHTDTTEISSTVPEARLAQLVHLADSIARKCRIGYSGSFDSTTDPADKISQSLEVNKEQLEQLEQSLQQAVDQKAEISGLNSLNPLTDYCRGIAETAAQLATDNTKLSEQLQPIQTASSHLDFVKNALSSIDPSQDTLDIAEKFAAHWQKFYQTGPLCLYLTPTDDSQSTDAVLIEHPGHTEKLTLEFPTGVTSLPQPIENDFKILDARDFPSSWLFEQLEVEFDLSRTRLLPLFTGQKTVAVIVFELRYPAPNEKLEETFKSAAFLTAFILQIALTRQRNQRFAELFARLIDKPKKINPTPRPKPEQEHITPQPQPEPLDNIEALAEMAAGAAHELNNPLTVISGRTQLLAESEAEEEKKQILYQINENAAELSMIIDGLMSFARPQTPRPQQTPVSQILDEAAQLAAQKTDADHLDIQLELTEDHKTVFVDSAQIASAIANIFSNSLESYPYSFGPIKVNSTLDSSAGLMKLSITDTGCGMDNQTLIKATNPFFSAKPAGRKRGMGLAYASRLIKLNSGSLNITSQPGKGTTVTVSLPYK